MAALTATFAKTLVKFHRVLSSVTRVKKFGLPSCSTAKMALPSSQPNQEVLQSQGFSSELLKALIDATSPQAPGFGLLGPSKDVPLDLDGLNVKCAH